MTTYLMEVTYDESPQTGATKVMNKAFEIEANQYYPDGCKCTDGSCDWCLVYYNGLPETYLVRATRLMIDAI